jgi:hypothetical protein
LKTPEDDALGAAVDYLLGDNVSFGQAVQYPINMAAGHTGAFCPLGVGYDINLLAFAIWVLPAIGLAPKEVNASGLIIAKRCSGYSLQYLICNSGKAILKLGNTCPLSLTFVFVWGIIVFRPTVIHVSLSFLPPYSL